MLINEHESWVDAEWREMNAECLLNECKMMVQRRKTNGDKKSHHAEGYNGSVVQGALS